MPSMKLENLLWSTRGKEWGFRFLHVPQRYSVEWSDIYQKIFGNDDRVPMRWWGIVVLPDGESITYVACRFFDSSRKWKDAAGREIPQEMLLEVESESAEEIANFSWQLPVMEYVRDYYVETYKKDPDAVVPFSFDPSAKVFIPKLRDQFSSVRLDLNIGNQQSKAESNKVWDRGGGMPLHQNIWNLLNMDVCELPARIKKYLSNQ